MEEVVEGGNLFNGDFFVALILVSCFQTFVYLPVNVKLGESVKVTYGV